MARNSRSQRRSARLFVTTSFAAIVAAVVLLMSGTASGVITDGGGGTGGPAIWTDQSNYLPGDTVTLTGAGWAPGEAVHIEVNDTLGKTWQHTADVISDDAGGFTDVFQLPSNFISDYDATATGATSGTATTTFTDGQSTIEQCENDNNNDNVRDPCNWITGSINPNSSAYREGDSVAFRTFLDGLVPDTNNTITIVTDFTKQTSGGKIVLGYDYLTSPDASESATSTRCTSIPGGLSLSTAMCNALSSSPQSFGSDPFTFSGSLSGQNAVLANQAVATRESGTRQFLIYGATAGGVSPITKVNNPNTDSSSQSSITLTFHTPLSGQGCTTKSGTTTCAVEIMWAAHLAKGTTDASGWGAGTGASSFPGSSLSERLDLVNGVSSGATNRSIQPAAVIPPGTITITKVTSPLASDLQDFPYTGSGAIGNFTLDTDTSDATFQNTRSFTVIDGNYTVTENNPLPAGWSLSSIQCTDPTNNTTTSGFTASIALAPNETVSCTFNNSKTLTPTVTTAIHNGSNHTTDVQNTPIALNSTIHDSVTVSGSAGTPTGNVTIDFFKNNGCTGTPFATSSSLGLTGGSVDATGFAQGPLGAGDYSFLAHYGGGGPYTSKDASCEKVTVSKATPGISTIVKDGQGNTVDNDHPAALGTAVHDTATLSGQVGTLSFNGTATVTYKFFKNNNCTPDPFSTQNVTVQSNGTVPPSSAQTLGAGSYSYQATYNGNANYESKTGACEPFKVSQATTGTTTQVKRASDNSNVADGAHVTAGDNVYDTATLSGGATGALAPTGTMSFYYQLQTTTTPNCSSGTLIAPAKPVNGNGTYQSSNLNVTTPGTYEFWAVYSGDVNHVGSTSTCGTETVVMTPPIGAKTIGYWRNKNGQAIITNYCKGVDGTSGTADDLAAFLRQYNPYKDLSSTATCSQIASYVTNIINAATKTKINDPSNLNAMLRAQMLATALDVYFSDPALGGNRIGAAAPIGGLVIDLTQVCNMIDDSGGSGTCVGVENASAAFGGATSMKVRDMLAYAASQATSPTGSTWYGQVKSIQKLAKDAFDSINNSVAIVI